jgi:alpha-methylacyl-CoA racemase
VSDLPLSGVRILDLSRLLPGPYATRALAELGAEVWKVEPPDGGDYTRWYPPVTGDPPMSGMFRELNRGKRGLALDMRSDAGRTAIRALAMKADVLVDTYRPGVLAKNGLDPRDLMSANPRLIYCAITGFGLTGPDVHRAGHDLGYLARAGAIAVTGTRASPMVMGIQVADVGASLVAVSGILAALFRREKTGKGSVVDTSLVESGLAFNVLNFGSHHASGERVVRGEQLLDGSRPCYAIYETKDRRHLALGALEPKFWQTFVSALGLDHLAGDALALGDEATRVRAEVQAKLHEKTLAEWTEFFRTVDCCAEPILEVDEVEHDAHLRARGVSDGAMVRSPIRVAPDWSTLASAPTAALSDAPALGADTEQVLREAGLDEDTIASLRRS